MTENEAIKNIKALNALCWQKDFYDEEFARALASAIKSLEEIQQYRTLGTVEEIKSLIEESEEEFNMLMEYRALGTAEELREAMEKQRAKKPIRIGMCTCPGCGAYNEIIKKRRHTVNQDIVYCWHCGQAVEVKRSEEE